MTFRIHVFVYVDETFGEKRDFARKEIKTLFFGKYGLQKIFNLKGLDIEVKFGVIGIRPLGYSTHPSPEQLR